MLKVYGAVVAVAVLVLGSASAFADAYDPTTLFSSIDLSKFGTAVGTLGGGILLIVLALRAISVVKAGVNKL